MPASPSPSVVKWKSCHSPNDVITCVEAMLCLHGLFLIGSQNRRLYLEEEDVCFQLHLYLTSQEQ